MKRKRFIDERIVSILKRCEAGSPVEDQTRRRSRKCLGLRCLSLNNCLLQMHLTSD